jgi:hypothetical protein
MPMLPEMPKMSRQLVGQLVAAGAMAFVVAGALAYIASNQLAYSADGIRSAALNVASLVVAFLLVAGLGRGEKGKP